MNIKETLISITRELEQCLQQIDTEQMADVTVALQKANRIFVYGTGRSLLMIRAFAMRLMHLGHTVYVVGETNTPAISEQDILIIASGSGETKTLVTIAEKCKKLQVPLALITTDPSSTIARLADYIIQIHTSTSKTNHQEQASVQPGGNTFEQSLLLLTDAWIVQMFAQSDIKQQKQALMKQHANLE